MFLAIEYLSTTLLLIRIVLTVAVLPYGTQWGVYSNTVVLEYYCTVSTWLLITQYLLVLSTEYSSSFMLNDVGECVWLCDTVPYI